MNTKYPRQVRIIRNARKAMGYSQQQAGGDVLFIASACVIFLQEEGRKRPGGTA